MFIISNIMYMIYIISGTTDKSALVIVYFGRMKYGNMKYNFLRAYNTSNGRILVVTFMIIS